MKLGSCAREKEVKDLLERGHWPEACAPDLRLHVSGCRNCGDLVLVTETFRNARAAAAGAAKLGSPGLLWWRAQLRRRNAAVERIGRPLLSAQIFALATILLLTVGFVVSQARHGLGWLTWLEGLPEAGTLHLGNLWPTALFDPSWSPLVLVPAVATLVLLGGAVVYLVSEKQ